MTTPPDSRTGPRSSTTRRGISSLRRIVAILGGIVSVLTAVLVVGTFWPSAPIVGTAGSFILPEYVSPFIVLGVIGAALSFASCRLGFRQSGTALTVVGLLAAAGSGVVLSSQVATGKSIGASINLPSTLLLQNMGKGATPDKTITFSRAGGSPLKMDLYLPKETSLSNTAPVVIYTHGGGWILGDRKGQAANLRWFADQGYLVVSADYSLATSKNPSWDTADRQVACAYAWVGAHASKYGGDIHRFFAFGESAGGALSLTTTYAAAHGAATSSCGGSVPNVNAVAAEYPAVDPVSFYDNDDLVLGGLAQSMVSGYLGGQPVDHEDRVRRVSSATYISKEAPPTLMFLNGSDHLVPKQGADAFVSKARGAGVNITVVSYRWADHSINDQFHSATNQAMLQGMDAFFKKHGA